MAVYGLTFDVLLLWRASVVPVSRAHGFAGFWHGSKCARVAPTHTHKNMYIYIWMNEGFLVSVRRSGFSVMSKY